MEKKFNKELELQSFDSNYSRSMREAYKELTHDHNRLKRWSIFLIVMLVLCIIVMFGFAEYVKHEVNDFTAQTELKNERIKTLEDTIDRIISEKEKKINDGLALVDSLEAENAALESKIEALNSTIESMQYSSNFSSNKQIHNVVANSDFKAWMDKRTITDKSSKQYEIVNAAVADNNGIMQYNNAPCVATGSKYGSVGDTLKITLDTGKTFTAVKADCKSDLHTINGTVDKNNKSAVEFIVDRTKLNKKIKTSGTVSALSEYAGEVTTIEVL